MKSVPLKYIPSISMPKKSNPPKKYFFPLSLLKASLCRWTLKSINIALDFPSSFCVVVVVVVVVVVSAVVFPLVLLLVFPTITFESVPLVEFMCVVYACLSCESYYRRFVFLL